MRTHHHAYHPAYGLAAQLAPRAVPYAEEHGIIAASEQFNVSQSTIYRWLADARVTQEVTHDTTL